MFLTLEVNKERNKGERGQSFKQTWNNSFYLSSQINNYGLTS